MHTALPYDELVTFIEAPLFSRLLPDYMDDEAYAELQWALALHPEAGAVVPGSGGVRKMRWAGSGRGKRGGLRVIYYWRRSESEIWMLNIYAKAKQENAPVHLLRALKEAIEHGKDE